MSTLQVAAIAAGAAQHSSRNDTVGMYVGIAFGLYVVIIAFGWALGAIRNRLPRGKWRNRVHLAGLFIFYPQSFFLDDKGLSKSIRAQVHNLFAVRRKKYVGRVIVCISPDDSIRHVAVVRTWWDNGSVFGTFATGGLINISDLLQRGGQSQTSNGGWFFTPERWAVVEPELRAFHEEQRRQHAAQQSAAFSKGIMDALAVLGLTPAATLDDVTDARNRLMQVNHPDHGGSTAAAQRINAAHDMLRSAVRQAA